MELKLLVISLDRTPGSASSAFPVEATPRIAVYVFTFFKRWTAHAGATFLALPEAFAVGVCPLCRCCAARHLTHSLDQKSARSASIHDHPAYAATMISAFDSHDLKLVHKR
jgi:hypothetical protein